MSGGEGPSQKVAEPPPVEGESEGSLTGEEHASAAKSEKSRPKKGKKGGRKRTSKKVEETATADEAPSVAEAPEEPKTSSEVVASPEADENVGAEGETATVADLDAELADLDSQGAVNQIIAAASSLEDSGEDEGTTDAGYFGDNLGTAPAGEGDGDVEVFDLDADADDEGLEVIDLDADLAIEAPEEPPDEGPGDEDSRERLVAQAKALVGSDEEPGPTVLDAIQGDASLVEEEDEEVVDLGPTSTPEARERLLAAALSHAEMQEARYRVPIDTHRQRQWRAPWRSRFLCWRASSPSCLRRWSCRSHLSS